MYTHVHSDGHTYTLRYTIVFMSWTSDELAALLTRLRGRGGDSALVEVKRATGGVPRLAETLCAFGNMPSGGTIVLGVDETAGFTITGVSDVAAMEAAVASQARTAVTPPVQTEFEVVDLHGRQVLIVTVTGLPAVDKPCRTGGRAYLRQGDGDYVMSEQETAQLVALQDRPRWDSAAVGGSAVTDLDRPLLGAVLEEARASSRRLADRPDADVLRLKGVVTAGGQLTVAGLYGLGAYPQQYMPSLALTAAAAPAQPGQRLVDLAHLDGPLPDLLDQAVEWVRRNTRTGVVFDESGHGADQPEIPLVAVREFIANALIHRDLSPRTQSKRVEVRLYPDRLVISNPGGLWGVSSDRLGQPGGKSAVNEFLYDIGRLLRTQSGHRVIEGEGGGIREAEEALAAAGLPAPLFIDTGVSFTVIVYRQPPGPAADPTLRPVEHRGLAPVKNDHVVLQALADGAASSADLAIRTGLTRRQVKYAMDKLIDSGRVTVHGGQGRRSTVYSRCDSYSRV